MDPTVLEPPVVPDVVEVPMRIDQGDQAIGVLVDNRADVREAKAGIHHQRAFRTEDEIRLDVLHMARLGDGNDTIVALGHIKPVEIRLLIHM
jgi:hypothetical protein